MSGNELMDLAVLERKKYNCLSEVLGLSQILSLAEVDDTAKTRLEGLDREERERLEELRSGADQARNDAERTFLEQSGRTRRLLERVVELDRRISLRMAGDHSFYHAGPPSRRPEAEEH